MVIEIPEYFIVPTTSHFEATLKSHKEFYHPQKIHRPKGAITPAQHTIDLKEHKLATKFGWENVK